MATDAPKIDTKGNFIRDIVAQHVADGTYGGAVVTRFPPEPNGYPHIGHAKSIVLNFGLARAFGGRCHLRMDDTNPETEDMEYVEALMRDVRWLGYEWDAMYYASDYFEQLYAWAVELVQKGLAYVDSQDEEAIRAQRGTVTEPGTNSPYRDRPVAESLDLLARMKDGAFEDGTHILRAKIDMAHPNMKMRDPIMYRIRRNADHYRRGNAWHIYPMYDWAHGQSDAIEGITHSICTLEFEINRELYDWYLDAIGITEPRNHQYEFARLNLAYTVVSKRKLLQLVNEERVRGWDDPRMPTLSGLRRRGVTPEAIRAFCEMIGVTKVDGRVDLALFEYAIRDDLNARAPRVLAVLRPLKVTITNWPEGHVEMLDAPYWPHDIPKTGSRPVPFSGTLYIERDDFLENPPKGFHRLTPGGEVRLRHAYILRCDEVVKDASGTVVELKCSYDPASKSGADTSGKKVKGTIHWVSAAHAVPAEVRLYDRLFAVPDPEDVPEGQTFLANLNPDSLEVLNGYVEPSLAEAGGDDRFQFERQGYFAVDPDTTPGALVFNRIVTLKDTWAKVTGKETESRGDGETGTANSKQPKKPASAANGTARDPRADLDADQQAAFDRYVSLGLVPAEARSLAEDANAATFFEAALAAHGNAKGLANWLIHELPRVQNDRLLSDLPFGPADLAALVALIDDGVVSTAGAKDVLAELAVSGGDPAALVEAKGLRQVSDAGALAPVVAQVLTANPDKVAAYRSGKTGLIGFFVGQAMKDTGGAANPALIKQLLEDALA